MPPNATAFGHIVGHNNFLERHGQGWRFRVRLPQRLRRLTARKELRVRLGTIPHAAALGHARALRVKAQRLFEVVSTMGTIEEAETAIEAWNLKKTIDLLRLPIDIEKLKMHWPGSKRRHSRLGRRDRCLTQPEATA